ncbi:MAG: hypothetical protein NTW79_04495 [Candidatus Berkelbacteria bacterium]|nr:hypothetical protein [Candidatus Berkelbacteria bacterium]
MAEDNVENVLQEFQNQLFVELGFDKFSPEEKVAVEEKLAKLVNDRLINLILIYLPEEGVAELDEKISAGNQEEIAKFLGDNIPGAAEKIANELLEIRSEIIEKMKNG